MPPMVLSCRMSSVKLAAAAGTGTGWYCPATLAWDPWLVRSHRTARHHPLRTRTGTVPGGIHPAPDPRRRYVLRSFPRSLVTLILLVLAAMAIGGTAPVGAAQPDAGTETLPTVSLGPDHACALRANGSVWCWSNSPGDDSNPPAEHTFRLVTAGGNLHSCGIVTDGSVRCWGDDSDDQSSPPTDRFRDVSAGGRHTCGVRTDGTLACWGLDNRGQSTPPAGQFRQVSAGDAHSCALAVDGSVACWGSNSNGQTSVPPGTYVAVSAGFAHTCAVRADGTAACWGNDDNDQTAPPADQLMSVSSGYNHSCGLTPGGRAVCWGHDAYGESTVPQDAFLSVTAGYLTTCGVRPDATITCWGYESWAGPLAEPPGPVGRWAVGSAARHSCAVSSESLLYCWGAADQGQDAVPAGAWRQVSLGDTVSCGLSVDGSPGCWGAPAQGSPPAVPLRQLAVSDTFACGIAGDGSLTCWGSNDNGRASPPAGAFRSVAVGADFGCAIAADGTLACWGSNDHGRASPPAGTFIALAAGNGTACAIAADGSLACWGNGDDGRATPPAGRFLSVGVGDATGCALTDDGTPTCWGLPLPATAASPDGSSRLTQLSVGGDHACAVVSNGILDCWGADDVGQAQPPIPGAPVVSRPIDPQVAIEDQAFELELPEDVFTDEDPLVWSAELEDGQDLPAWLEFHASELLFAGAPADADVGQVTIALIATDTEGLAGRTTFTITVENSQDLPLTGRPMPDQDLVEDSAWSFVLPDDAFIDDDLDSGDSFTWSVAGGDGQPLPGWLTFDPATHTLSGTPARADIGQLSLLVTVTDTAGQEAQSFLTLRIERVNHPPTVQRAIPEQKAIQDQEFTFTFDREAFSEPDSDDQLQFDATQKGGDALPSWLAFGRGDRTFRGVPRDADVGTLVITLTATDKAGAAASLDFALRIVDVNDPPSLVTRLADQTVVQDQPFVYTLFEDAFTDPDLDTGDSLRLRAVGREGGPLPLWLSFDPETRTFAGIPRDADTGPVVITVTAVDSVGNEAAGSFTLTVEDVNDAPVVSQPIPDQVAPVNQRFSLVVAPDMFLDADADKGDQMEISVAREDRSELPGWLTFDAETFAFAGTPTDGDVGPVSVSIIARDRQGGEGVDTFVIDVRPESDLPSAPTAAVRRAALSSDGRVPIAIDWSAGKEATQGRPRYRLDMRARGKKGWGKYTPLLFSARRTGTNQMLRPGTYQLRVRAALQGGKPGPWVEGVPFRLTLLSDTDPTIDYEGSWSRFSRKVALRGQTRRTNRPGDSFRVPVNGTQVSLVMTTGPGTGVIDACIDPGTDSPGSCRTIDLSTLGRGARNVVTAFRDLPPGDHTLVVTARQAPVELDAIVIIADVPPEPPAPSPAPEG
jgi:alpha-tubulin suppressor-like RCC1 family protein